MSLTRKQVRAASRIVMQPGGVHVIQERIFFPQENRHLQPDDVRDAVMLVAPVDDSESVNVYGFRSQDAVFESLQTGSGWDVDGTGFNFSHVVPPDVIADRGRSYFVEIVLTVLGSTESVATYELRSKYTINGGSGLW